MPADLEAIVAAARRRTLEFTDHYIHEREGQGDRPTTDEIQRSLREGELTIASDDLGARDDRGAVCEVRCRSRSGRRMAVRINYEKSPMLVVTAYWMSRDG